MGRMTSMVTTPSFVPGPLSLVLCVETFAKDKGPVTKDCSGNSLKRPLDDRAHRVDIFVGNRRRRHEEARPIRAGAGYECYDAQVEKGREEAFDDRLITPERRKCDHRAQAERTIHPSWMTSADVLEVRDEAIAQAHYPSIWPEEVTCFKHSEDGLGG